MEEVDDDKGGGSIPELFYLDVGYLQFGSLANDGNPHIGN